MRIVTWNVNSVRARQERLLDWLKRHEPDVLCLQELKGEEEKFPLPEVQELGYQAAVYGQKTYNGVAILSRHPLEEVEKGFGDDDSQARYIAATIQGVRVACIYVPNGSEVGDEKYAYKQDWLQRLEAHLEKGKWTAGPFALCGDINIAPEDRDAAKPEEWRGSVLLHPEMSQAFQRLLNLGLVDSLRLHEADGGIFSWWDYRNLGFPKNNGLRIDHILVSPSLAKRCERVWVDRDERKGKKPSDHAPVVADLSAS